MYVQKNQENIHKQILLVRNKGQSTRKLDNETIKYWQANREQTSHQSMLQESNR